VPESDQGNVDLNGDGAASAGDEVVHVWNGSTIVNVGYDAGNYEALEDTGAFAFNVGEAAQNDDLNGDGDMVLDHMVFVWDGTAATGGGVASDADPGYGPLADGGLAFNASEPREGSKDLNGDGDAGDSVLFVARLATNQAPVCTAARPSIATLWPPDHRLVAVEVGGVTDPDGDDVSITVDGITQDEPGGRPRGRKHVPRRHRSGH
jgi:hypothetical protein